MHYADPSYVSPERAARRRSTPGTTVHDPTFWQPLNTQRFVDAQWGDVRTFAGRVRVGKPPFGIPSSAAYKDAAIAVLRATSGTRAATVDTSPLAWNRIAAAAATGNLAQDLRLYRTLNGALNDAAVSAWAAKREYQAPRPISMIRYLAFNGQLPIVARVSKRVGKHDLRPLGRPLDPGSGVDVARADACVAGLGVRGERIRLRRERRADQPHRPLVHGAGAAARAPQASPRGSRHRRTKRRDAPSARRSGSSPSRRLAADSVFKTWTSPADKASVVDIEFTNPLMRTLADAGVTSEEELQQSSESEGAVDEGSLASMERELESATAQLAAVREHLGHLREYEDTRERELLLVREQNAKLREARLADAVRVQALEAQLAERNEQAAAIAATLADAARALGSS